MLIIVYCAHAILLFMFCLSLIYNAWRKYGKNNNKQQR